MAGHLLRRISSPHHQRLAASSLKLRSQPCQTEGPCCYSVNSQVRLISHPSCKEIGRSRLRLNSRFPIDSRSLVQNRHYSVELDSTDLQGHSLDKKIQLLMGKWYLDDAVELVKRSVALGEKPSGNTVMILLKHLAELGDIENAIELTSILFEHNLVLKKNAHPLLSDAFRNSGEIEMGIEYLELTYNATKTFDDIDVIFPLLTFVTFKEFPEKAYLVEDFVRSIEEKDKNRALAQVWKCFMLMEQFDKADELLEANQEKLKSVLPVAINEICQMKDRIPVDREVVMTRLCQMEILSRKQRILAYETLLNIFDSKRNWKKLLSLLLKTRALCLPLQSIQIYRHMKNLEDATRNDADEDVKANMKILHEWAKTL